MKIIEVSGEGLFSANIKICLEIIITNNMIFMHLKYTS